MLKKFLIGEGFENPELNDIIVSSDIFGDITLSKLHAQISQTVSRQNAAALAVGFDANYNVAKTRHIPYRDVRFGQDDSNDYSGLIHYYNNWHKDRYIGWKPSDIAKINAFNPKPEIVASQWKKFGKDYRGQIAVLRMDDEYIYPLAPIDPALEDADTETQIKLFKNGELNKGFFAKYIMHHTAFANDRDQEEFKQVLKKFEGGDHDSSIMLMDAEFDESGKIVEGRSVHLEKIEQNINDKIFESYEKSVSNNIRKAHDSIPAILIEQQDGSFFGSSGEAFVQAFNFYNTQTDEKRDTISRWYKEIFKYSANPLLRGADFTIKKLSYGTVDTI